MPRTRNERLISDEGKVLGVLQKNAHESIDAVAKKCGFSRQKVWRIIKKLEKDKIIWGYTTICDDETMDQKHYIVLVKRSPVPLDKKTINEILSTRLEDLVTDLHVRIENIEFIHGSYDVVFSFWTDNLISAKRFCEQFNEHYLGYIASYELSETIFTVRRASVRNPHIKEQIKFL
ncbi:MAG TPA: Lrp/AsnC family transcriptional regulator [Candidatus Thermoplasmatota archaeon]|nr:Lrp/AsnC family transcriptional regulator [Candidatus Thermoplasmatota archaeon]